jgi:SAM-dependent methyltransferase
MDQSPGNAGAIEAWNTVLFDKFSTFRHIVTKGFADHGLRAMDRHPPRPGSRVVDIGCGFADTTLELAQRVGASGSVVGVDCAARFIEVGRADAAEQRVANATFELADVEAGVPGGPYDLAFSRMGTMFFARPVIALREIRRALRPGGQLCMVVWRQREANECFHLPERIVRELLGHPPKGDQVTCGPGPFSMASADLVSDQLLAAGYDQIAFERSDCPIQIGEDLERAARFSLTLGPAGEVVRLSGQEGVAREQEIMDALRAGLAPLARPDGVWAAASCWIVTARAPADNA